MACLTNWRTFPAACAFITLARWSEAEAAIEGLNGKMQLDGSKAALVVKFADAKVRSAEAACLPACLPMDGRVHGLQPPPRSCITTRSAGRGGGHAAI